MRHWLSRSRRFFKTTTSARRYVGLAVAVAVLFTFSGVAAASAATMPSGQVMFGRTTFDAGSGRFVGGGGTVEPAYDDGAAGSIVYLLTPNGSHVHPANQTDPATGMPRDVAPLYLPVYPTTSIGIDPTTLNCAHVPADNCPDHGPAVAGAAMSIVPGVYAGGVLGHDHLVGIASTGGDFNVLWEPVLLLFTSSAAATEHILTLDQITTDLNAGTLIQVPLPQLDFKCSVVSAKKYQQGIPAPTVVGP